MGWYHGITHRHKLDRTLSPLHVVRKLKWRRPLYSIVSTLVENACYSVNVLLKAYLQCYLIGRRRLLYSVYSVLLSHFLLFNCKHISCCTDLIPISFSYSIHSFLNLPFIDPINGFPEQ